MTSPRVAAILAMMAAVLPATVAGVAIADGQWRYAAAFAGIAAFWIIVSVWAYRQHGKITP